MSAADDVDSADGTATFTHSASGGGYDSVAIGSVAATEDDNDAPGVTVSETDLTVAETGSATYTVVLDTEPTGPVTVTVAKTSGGDGDLTVAPAALTFTTADWNAAQSFTVSAADDFDSADGTGDLHPLGQRRGLRFGHDWIGCGHRRRQRRARCDGFRNRFDGGRDRQRDLHGGAGHGADRAGDGDGGEDVRRRRRPDRGPGGADLHDGGLERGAIVYGERGGRLRQR